MNSLSRKTLISILMGAVLPPKSLSTLNVIKLPHTFIPAWTDVPNMESSSLRSWSLLQKTNIWYLMKFTILPTALKAFLSSQKAQPIYLQIRKWPVINQDIWKQRITWCSDLISSPGLKPLKVTSSPNPPLLFSSVLFSQTLSEYGPYCWGHWSVTSSRREAWSMSGAHDCVELQVPLEALREMSYLRGRGSGHHNQHSFLFFSLPFHFSSVSHVFYISL